jgi:hypothetical protein
MGLPLGENKLKKSIDGTRRNGYSLFMNTTEEMKMEIAIGSKWVSGNSMFPTHETVTAILEWAQVPAREQKAWRTIEHWLKNESDFTSRAWVVTKSVRGSTVSPMDVFTATRYVSQDVMIRAYLAKAA